MIRLISTLGDWLFPKPIPFTIQFGAGSGNDIWDGVRDVWHGEACSFPEARRLAGHPGWESEPGQWILVDGTRWDGKRIQMYFGTRKLD